MTVQKKKLRNKCRQARQNLSVQQIQNSSHIIAEKLFTSPSFIQAKNIASYMPIDNEVDTQVIHEHCWQQNKSVLLPVVTAKHEMAFVEHLQSEALIKNQYDIPEPQMTSKNTVSNDQIDCMLIPLVGFDSEGNRLGFGGGFYDHYLQNHKPICIGLAFEVQRINSLEKEKWDIPMDIIITDRVN